MWNYSEKVQEHFLIPAMPVSSKVRMASGMLARCPVAMPYV